jgi:hypothetical protein
MTPYRVPEPPPVPPRPRLRRHRPARGIDANLSLMLVVATFYVVALLIAHTGVFAWAIHFTTWDCTQGLIYSPALSPMPCPPWE